MDLRTHDNFVVDWAVAGTDITMTFKDNTETTTLGTITIQTTRLKSFLESLSEVATVYAPPVNDTIDRDFSTTSFIEGKSRISF